MHARAVASPNFTFLDFRALCGGRVLTGVPYVVRHITRCFHGKRKWQSQNDIEYFAEMCVFMEKDSCFNNKIK